MSSALKTSSEKSTSKIFRWRYIFIVGAALILAIALYTLLHVSDANDDDSPDAVTSSELTQASIIGVRPASFQQIGEFLDGSTRKLRLSGQAEPYAIIVITNRGVRLRQVLVNELGQWGVTLDVEDRPMALEAQLYMGDDEERGIRSEETVFRIPIPADEADETSKDEPAEPAADVPDDAETTKDSLYKSSALIMVAAPGSPSRIIQSPYGSAPSSGPLSLSVIDYDVAGGVIITGTSSVPGRIRFYAQNSVIGETGIGVGGRWNFIAGRLLPRAQINIRAELIPAQGAPNAPEVPASIAVPFNFLRPLQEEDTDGSGALSVYIDTTQWQVRRTLIGGGGQTTVIFAPSVVEPSNIAE